MASARSSGRLGVVVAILAFVAGCWAGMGSDATGDPWCVVTVASAAGRPGAVPGEIVEPTPSPETDDDSGGDSEDASCHTGEPEVCGQFEDGDGDARQFVSEECSD